MGFNPSRGIAIIQTDELHAQDSRELWFQSLTRDSNHSNMLNLRSRQGASEAFQSLTRDSNHSNILALTFSTRAAAELRFNPSRGIAIIQTPTTRMRCSWLSRCFNPSRGIAIIQTPRPGRWSQRCGRFQSLTRDSNHSNRSGATIAGGPTMFQSLTRDSNHSNR